MGIFQNRIITPRNMNGYTLLSLVFLFTCAHAAQQNESLFPEDTAVALLRETIAKLENENIELRAQQEAKNKLIQDMGLEVSNLRQEISRQQKEFSSNLKEMQTKVNRLDRIISEIKREVGRLEDEEDESFDVNDLFLPFRGFY